MCHFAGQKNLFLMAYLQDLHLENSGSHLWFLLESTLIKELWVNDWGYPRPTNSGKWRFIGGPSYHKDEQIIISLLVGGGYPQSISNEMFGSSETFLSILGQPQSPHHAPRSRSQSPFDMAWSGFLFFFSRADVQQEKGNPHTKKKGNKNNN